MYKYSLEQLREIAAELALKIQPPHSILLEGDVGAGKTTFSQFFIQKLLKDLAQPVTSPTFNIVQIYDTVKGAVWHVDLYRIKHEEEIFELGLFEAMHECICLIEWSQLLFSDALKKYTENCKYTMLRL